MLNNLHVAESVVKPGKRLVNIILCKRIKLFHKGLFANRKKLLFRNQLAFKCPRNNIRQKLHGNLVFVVLQNHAHFYKFAHIVKSRLLVQKAKLRKPIGILQNRNLGIKPFNLVHVPNCIQRTSAGEHVLKPVCAKTRNIVVCNWIAVVVVNLVLVDSVAKKKLAKLQILVNHFLVVKLGTLLGKRISVPKINHMAKGRGRNIMKKPRKGLFFVVGKIPNYKGSPNRMFQARIIKAVLKKRSPVSPTQKRHAVQALQNRKP